MGDDTAAFTLMTADKSDRHASELCQLHVDHLSYGSDGQMALTDIASLSSLATRYFFQRAFQPSRNPHGPKTTAPS